MLNKVNYLEDYFITPCYISYILNKISWQKAEHVQYYTNRLLWVDSRLLIWVLSTRGCTLARELINIGIMPEEKEIWPNDTYLKTR